MILGARVTLVSEFVDSDGIAAALSEASAPLAELMCKIVSMLAEIMVLLF
jgi:hypothetical protein